MEQYEIYFANFDNNKDCVINGVRPCVVVQNNIGNNYSPTVIVVPLTTANRDFPTHSLVMSTKKPSYALCEQILTISKNQILDRVGRLSTYEIANLRKAIRKALAL